MMRLQTLVGSLALLGLASHAAAQTQGERVVITGSLIKRIAAEGALPIQVIRYEELVRQGVSSTEQLIMQLNINGNGLDNLASNADVVDGAARGNNGATSANLRGQGSNATLILLNGRRVASHGLNGGTVDLNQIPFAAIDRIEVLKDGASSIYGTDAIGGVINFILRTNMSGVVLNAGIDKPQDKGGEIYSAAVTAGFGDLNAQGFNALLSLSVHDHKVLRGDQRDFVNTYQPTRGLSPDTRGAPIATLFAVSSQFSALSRDNIDGTGRGTGPLDFANPALRVNGINILDLPGQAGCLSVDGMSPYQEVLWASAASKYGCAWDTGRAAVIQQPVKNTNLVARGTLKLGEHRIIVEGLLGKSESAKRFSNNQISASNVQSVLLPDGVTRVANPFLGARLFYPATAPGYNAVVDVLEANFAGIKRGQPLNFRWRCLPCGEREITTETDTSRYLLAAEGPLFDQWEYRAGVSQAQSQSESLVGNGYHYQEPFARMISEGRLNPFSLQQTPQAIAELNSYSAKGVRLYDGKFTMQQTDFVLSGPLFKLPGGTAMAAAGVDLRTEKYIFTGDTRPNANALSGQVYSNPTLGIANLPIAADQTLIFNVPFDNALATAGTLKRDIKAVYAEVAMPLFKGFEVTGSVRRDDYTGFGTTTNPKVALRWAPAESFLMRGAYSTGFRVPTFKQSFDPPTGSAYTGRDFPDPETCPSGVVSSTDPNCAAVTPTVVFGGRSDLKPEESKMTSLGFVFQFSDALSGNVDYWDIERDGTIQDLALTTMAANYRFFRDRFTRVNGVLVAVDRSWINAGATRTKGLEFGLRSNFDGFGARWLAAFDVSYLLEKKSKLTPAAPFGTSEVGRFTRAGDLGIRWKHTFSITRTEGHWTATVTQVYRGKYADFVLPGVANGTYPAPDWNPIVKPYEVWHASLRYSGVKNLTLTAGIKNLFNEDPPFSVTYDTNTGAGSSWEPRVADPRGRSYVLRAEYKF